MRAKLRHGWKKASGLLLALVMLLGSLGPGFVAVHADSTLPEVDFDLPSDSMARIAEPILTCEVSEVESGKRFDVLVSLNVSLAGQTLPDGEEGDFTAGVIRGLEVDVEVPAGVTFGANFKYTNVTSETNGNVVTFTVDGLEVTTNSDVYIGLIEAYFPDFDTKNGTEAEFVVTAMRWDGSGLSKGKIALDRAGIAAEATQSALTVKAEADYGTVVSAHTVTGNPSIPAETAAGTTYTGALTSPPTFKFSLADLLNRDYGHLDSKVTITSTLAAGDGMTFVDAASFTVSNGGSVSIESDGKTATITWVLDFDDMKKLDNLSVTVDQISWNITSEAQQTAKITHTITVDDVRESFTNTTLYSDTSGGDSKAVTLGSGVPATKEVTITKGAKPVPTVPPVPKPEDAADKFAKAAVAEYTDVYTSSHFGGQFIDHHRTAAFSLTGFDQANVALTGLRVIDYAKGHKATLMAAGLPAAPANYVDNAKGYNLDELVPTGIYTGKFTGPEASGKYTINVYYTKGGTEGCYSYTNRAFNTSAWITFADTAELQGATVIGIEFNYGDVPANFTITEAPVVIFEAKELTNAYLNAKTTNNKLINDASVTYSYESAPFAGAANGSVTYHPNLVTGLNKSASAAPDGRAYYMQGDKVTYTLSYTHSGAVTAEKIRVRDVMEYFRKDSSGNVILENVKITVGGTAVPGAGISQTIDGYEVIWEITPTAALTDGQELKIVYTVEIGPGPTADTKFYELRNAFWVKWYNNGDPHEPGGGPIIGDPGPGPGEDWGNGNGSAQIEVSTTHPTADIRKWVQKTGSDAFAKALTDVELGLGSGTDWTAARVQYAIEVKNTSEITVPQSVIVDKLPAGLIFDKATSVVSIKVGSATLSTTDYDCYVKNDTATGDSVVYVIKKELKKNETIIITYKVSFATHSVNGKTIPVMNLANKHTNTAYYYALQADASLLGFDRKSAGTAWNVSSDVKGAGASTLAGYVAGVAAEESATLTAPTFAISANAKITNSLADRKIAVTKYTMIGGAPVENGEASGKSAADATAIKLAGEARFLLIAQSKTIEAVDIYKIYDILPPGVTVPMKGGSVDIAAMKIYLHQKDTLANMKESVVNQVQDGDGKPYLTLSDGRKIELVSVALGGKEAVTVTNGTGATAQCETLIFTFKTTISGTSTNTVALKGLDDSIAIQYSVKVQDAAAYLANGDVRATFGSDPTGYSKAQTNTFGVQVDSDVGFVDNGVATQPSSAVTAAGGVWNNTANNYFENERKIFEATSTVKYRTDFIRPDIQKYVYTQDSGGRYWLNDGKTANPPYFTHGRQAYWGITLKNLADSKVEVADYVVFDILPPNVEYDKDAAKFLVLTTNVPTTGKEMPATSVRIAIDKEPDILTLSDGRQVIAWKSANLPAEAQKIAVGGSIHIVFPTKLAQGVIGLRTNDAYFVVNSDWAVKHGGMKGSYTDLGGSDFTQIVSGINGVESDDFCLKSSASLSALDVNGTEAKKDVVSATDSTHRATGGQPALVLSVGDEFYYEYTLANRSSGQSYNAVEIADILPIKNDGHVRMDASRGSQWAPTFLGGFEISINKLDGTVITKAEDFSDYTIYLRKASGAFAKIATDANGYDVSGASWMTYDAWLTGGTPEVDAFVVKFDNGFSLTSERMIVLKWKMEIPADLDRALYNAEAWNSAAFKISAGSRGNTYSEPPKVGVRASNNSVLIVKERNGGEDTTFNFRLTGKDAGQNDIIFAGGSTEHLFSITVDGSGVGQIDLTALQAGTYILEELTTGLQRTYTVTISGPGVKQIQGESNKVEIEIQADKNYEIKVINKYEPPGTSTPPRTSTSPSPSESTSPSPSGSTSPSPSGSEPPETSPSTSPGTTPSTQPSPGTSGGRLEEDEDGSYVEYNDEGIPLGTWTYDEELDEWVFEEIPLGVIPEAGGISVIVFILLGAGMIVAGIVLERKGRKNRA
ncbi:hypothetical protein LJC32_04220 [Oscillospiraceae bacterium OttesenSCG-928-F05]|nr:hypothetical protein [Oscillospiraceae bacterium OttesenSCG-928-F05]